LGFSKEEEKEEVLPSYYLQADSKTF